MTKECAAREAIQDFNDLQDLLGDIASRNPHLQREKGLFTYTEQIAVDGHSKVQITARGRRGSVDRRGVRALHVATRHNETTPWQKASINLGGTFDIEGVAHHQLFFPSQNHQPRTSIFVTQIEQIPEETEEMLVSGISLFCR